MPTQAEFLVNTRAANTNPWVTRLVDTRSITMLPVSNAIGYDKLVREENHVDPNRDFPCVCYTCCLGCRPRVVAVPSVPDMCATSCRVPPHSYDTCTSQCLQAWLCTSLAPLRVASLPYPCLRSHPPPRARSPNQVHGYSVCSCHQRSVA